MVSRARRQLADLEVIRVDDALLDDAAELDPIHLRTLDALHIAAARALGPSLGMFVTYDARLAVAAGSVGLRVVAPR